jgi:hydroxymethylpyrimidine/phosphomethylpyrimidine kinase
MPPKRRLPVVLSIAGSDSAGLAGLQADLKTFAVLGVQGLTAVTAITAQNSREVGSIRVVPADSLLAQLEALRADFDIAAVKIGMLGSTANVRAVARWLRRHAMHNVVLDPVFVSTSGRRLLSAPGIQALRRELLPLATIVTPNVPEAEVLLARSLADAAALRDAASELGRHSGAAVLLKGGHAGGRTDVVVDHFADAHGGALFEHRRLPFVARGTGCTLASAIAAGLAKNLSLRAAVRRAEAHLQQCYRQATPVGRGEAFALGAG